MLVKYSTYKCEEFGLKLLEIFARGTSYFAYDGSGPVKREKAKASLATLETDGQYNADLNAAYNITARRLAILLKMAEVTTAAIPGAVAEDPVRPGQHVGRSSRMPTVLADVWAFHSQTLARASLSAALGRGSGRSAYLVPRQQRAVLSRGSIHE